MSPIETGSRNPLEALSRLQQLWVVFTSDETVLVFRGSTIRAWKKDGGWQYLPFDNIGDGKDKIVWLQSRSMVSGMFQLNVTYSSGEKSQFIISSEKPVNQSNVYQENTNSQLNQLKKIVNDIPWEVRLSYDVLLKNIRTLAINPNYTSSAKSLTATANTEGGHDFTLDQWDRFTKIEWDTIDLKKWWVRAQVLWSNSFEMLEGGNIVNTLDWLSQKWEQGRLIFSEKWIFSFCKQSKKLTFIPKDTTPQQFAAWGGLAKKPVIYLYPKTKQNIKVAVKLSGASMTTEYPATKNGEWNVEASPRGNLVDIITKKKYSYLFWEAEKQIPFTINEKNAFCIASSEAREFLEKSLKTLGLNTKEQNDFIVYWLPILEKNPFSVVEFKTKEYTDMAKLVVSPAPETIIRVFMVFKTSIKKISTGNPKLQKAKRKWYTLVEWGWTNLDETSIGIK